MQNLVSKSEDSKMQNLQIQNLPFAQCQTLHGYYFEVLLPKALHDKQYPHFANEEQAVASPRPASESVAEARFRGREVPPSELTASSLHQLFKLSSENRYKQKVP